MNEHMKKLNCKIHPEKWTMQYQEIIGSLQKENH